MLVMMLWNGIDLFYLFNKTLRTFFLFSVHLASTRAVINQRILYSLTVKIPVFFFYFINLKSI